LKHPDRVRLLQRRINGGVIRGQMAEINLFSMMLANNLK